MSFYDDFFGIFGKVVKHVNLIDGHITDVAEHQTILLGVIFTAGIDDIADGVPEVFTAFENDLTNWITADAKGLADSVITADNIVSSLPTITSTVTPRVVLEALYRQMLTDHQTILARDLAAIAPTVTVTTVNSLAAALAAVTILDGTTAPTAGSQPFSKWLGANSALFIEGSGGGGNPLELLCVVDSESGGAARGSEQWSIGLGVPNGPYKVQAEGPSPSNIACANNANLTPGGRFDGWDGSNNAAPPGWTAIVGSYGTFNSYVSGLRGTTGMYVVANGLTTLRYFLNPGALQRRKTYALGLVAKRLGTVTTTAVAKLGLYDANGLVGSAVDFHTLTTSWAFYSGAVTIPNQLDGQVYLEFKIASPGFDAVVAVDDVGIYPVTWFNGAGFVLMALDGKILVDDMIEADMTLNSSGVFADYLRQNYQFQLPQLDTSNTILDSLAT